MRYVAAYLLASLGGKGEPTSSDIEKILGSVGIESEDDKLSKVLSELKGKSIPELIEEGNILLGILLVTFGKCLLAKIESICRQIFKRGSNDNRVENMWKGQNSVRNLFFLSYVFK